MDYTTIEKASSSLQDKDPVGKVSEGQAEVQRAQEICSALQPTPGKTSALELLDEFVLSGRLYLILHFDILKL